MSTSLDFKLLNQKIILNNPWLKVFSNDYLLPNQTQLYDYYVVEDKNGVTIVALTDQQEILIVEQFRPPVETRTFDLPGGLIESTDSDPLTRAKQELQEETGYVSDEWIDLGYFYPAPHRLHNTQRCFLALNITKVADQNLDATEFVSHQLISLKTLDKMIQTNEFLCGYCITAYLKAKLYLGL